MPAVPRRPGPRRSARPLGSGLSRASTATTGKARRGLRGHRAGSSTPQAGTGPGDGPAAATGAGEAAAWVSPGGWPRFVFCSVGYFFLFFWDFVVFKIEGFTVTVSHHSSMLLRPGQQKTRGTSGPRRAPSPPHSAHGSTSSEAAAGCRREAVRQSPVPGFPSKALRVALLTALSAVCALLAALVPAAENEGGFLLPRVHPRRGDVPRLGGFPVPSALAGVPRAQLLPPAQWSRGLGKGGEAPMDAAVAPRNPGLSVISKSLSSTIKHYYYRYCY